MMSVTTVLLPLVSSLRPCVGLCGWSLRGSVMMCCGHVFSYLESRLYSTIPTSSLGILCYHFQMSFTFEVEVAPAVGDG